MARYLVGSLVVLGLAACGHSWLAERDAWRHEAEVACLKSGLVKEGPMLVRIEPISGPGICGADFPLKVAAIGEGAPIGFADELRPPGTVPVTRQPLEYPPPAAPNYTPRPAYPSQYPAEPPQQQYPPERAYPTQPAYPQAAQPYPQQTYPQPYQYPPAAPSARAYPPQYPQATAPAAPMSIHAPGTEPPDAEDDVEYETAPGTQPAQQPRYGAPQYRGPETRPATAQPYPPQRYPAEQVPLGPPRTPVTTGAVNVQPAATLACPIVSTLDTWFATGVQPAAMRWFGAPVAEIKQISAYSCRGMNGQRGAPISEHAFGNALDIAAFTLADGRRISVKDGWRGLPEEQGFLRDVHAAACQHFATVLAPGSNAFHYDHIHVDLMRRASGRTICNPAPIPGDQVAARAGYRLGARSDPGVTGSIKRSPKMITLRGRDEVYDRLPRAIPGED